LAIVIVAGIAGLVAMVAFLAQAGWSEGGIAGMVTGIGSIITGLILSLRNQAKTQETLADQNVTLDRVVEQTNGLSDRERQDIAQRAATSVVEDLRRQGLL
jgi:pyridoxal/pyridoxine/pyridoxamine kinase